MALNMIPSNGICILNFVTLLNVLRLIEVAVVVLKKEVIHLTSGVAMDCTACAKHRGLTSLRGLLWLN